MKLNKIRVAALTPVLILLVALTFLTASQKTGTERLFYKDASQSTDARVNDLLAKMTLEEKLAQIQCIWQKKAAFIDSKGDLLPDSAAVYLKNGIGQIGRPSEGFDRSKNTGRNAAEMARFTNQIQKYLVENTRLGIPAMFHEECLHGHAAKDATSFPQPIGLGSTWNRQLVENLFTMTAREARVRGTHQALTPVVDVVRDPRWGRTEETYGEDPYLCGEIGLAAIFGFQGRGETIGNEHVVATLKHMTGHGQPEGGNNISPADVPERMVREMFLPPFKKCVQQGHVRSIMPSYNEIDGVPSHASKWLLQDILRGEWGFKGNIVSDYYAIRELCDRHHTVPDHQAAAIQSLTTGVDLELPEQETYHLLKAVFEKGELPMSVLDTAVARNLRQKFELGLFENPYVDEAKAAAEVGSEKNAKLALQAAEEAMVMLQNNNSLAPISTDKYKTIAVIGPNADKELLGGYSDHPKYFVTVLQGIRDKVGSKARILYAEGCGITQPGSWYLDPVNPTDPAEDRKKIAAAVAIAKQADLVILAVGGNELTSREAWAETHLGDRTNLEMVGLQNELIDKIAATGKPIIGLLFNGRPLAVQNLSAKASTVFECWYLGQECGRAVANVLFGDVNPSGKLPISFPRSVGHIPAYYNYKPTARRGYLWDDVSPLYAFGYGMSYTSFVIGEPKLEKSTIGQRDNAVVSVEVKNTGNRAGKEVVQLYIHDKVGSVTRPVKELKGFEKIALQPGESKTVKFTLTPEELSMWDIDMKWVVEPGEFDIMVGSSSRTEDLKTTVLTVK
ncbi:MAG: glycoside hydrolase family 3 C-terminal domain-containing protein [Lewinellaceae bacterium]|nr:glycoside hydrolase family 3 C-terminal domain-containing protein [Saprospiraceae bacterium]MCB9340216.1 glycoside hydrolase family 3 C-terminal domain-containing protein [Lewinellaceae bacterium]